MYRLKLHQIEEAGIEALGDKKIFNSKERYYFNLNIPLKEKERNARTASYNFSGTAQLWIHTEYIERIE